MSNVDYQLRFMKSEIMAQFGQIMKDLRIQQLAEQLKGVKK